MAFYAHKTECLFGRSCTIDDDSVLHYPFWLSSQQEHDIDHEFWSDYRKMTIEEVGAMKNYFTPGITNEQIDKYLQNKQQ